MNILLEFTSLNHRTFHGLVMKLKEYYPEARFAGLVGLTIGDEHTYEFLKNQKDVHYEFLLLRHELAAQAMNSEIDFELLRNFEEGLKEKSIWRLVAADRLWGHAYVRGAYLRKAFITENASRENILRYLSGAIKSYQKIFDDFNVDLFVPTQAMGTVDVFIFEELCRQRKIPYAVTSTLRTKNYFAFGSDIAMRFPHVDKAYLELISGKRTTDLSVAERLYEEIISDRVESQHIDKQHPVHTMVKSEKFTRRKLIMASAKAIAGTLRRWIKQSKINTSDDIRRQPYTLAVLLDNIRQAVGMHIQRYHVMSPSFGIPPQPEDKYIYYPLHVNPEYSTNFMGTMWMDQLYNIELLSKSIPADWLVYVKEHPAMLIARVRPKGFYEAIKRLPNVRMAPVSVDGNTMIDHAQMVAIVTGTTGWEAILRGKPVIEFIDNYFDVIGLSRLYTSIENLSLDIKEECQRMANISAEERKRRIIYFLAALLEHGYTATHGPQLFYEPGTPEQYELCGQEMADALIHHLKHIGFLSGQWSVSVTS